MRFDSHPVRMDSVLGGCFGEGGQVCKNHPSEDERLPHVCEVRQKARLDGSQPSENVVLPKVEKRMPEVVPEHAMSKLFAEEVFDNDWKGAEIEA